MRLVIPEKENGVFLLFFEGDPVQAILASEYSPDTLFDLTCEA